MVLRSVLSLSIFLLSFQVSGFNLSENAEIIVVTMGPTQTELYSAFGHSGFRVLDSARKVDYFFNYGIFDFNQPNFYLNFTRGKLLYSLGLFHYPPVFDHYAGENRTITEQTLNLTQAEKQRVFDYLMENNKPENRAYYYNYIYDNCATKMRDVLRASLESEIIFDYSYVKEDLSYRDLMDLYLKYQPWGDLGIDICLGSEIDVIADGNGYMYLPDYVEIAFNLAKISTNGVEKPLVSETEKVHIPTPQTYENGTFSPLVLFVFVFFMIGLITHRGLKHNASYRWLDIVLFGLTGIIGVLLSLLWFATDHLSAYNWNILWAMPLNLVALYFLIKKKKLGTIKKYFLMYSVLLVCLITFGEFLPQSLHLALVPLVLGMAIRSLYLYFDIKKEGADS